MTSSGRNILLLTLALAAAATVAGCADEAGPGPRATAEILVTSAAGEKLATRPAVTFRDGRAAGTVVTVHPDSLRQVIEGIGTSFTESSAFVLAHLEPERRQEVMRRIYGREGADFTLARTHIGSCDFSVEGKYSYADVPGDLELASFSIAPDTAGFDPARYPGVRDAAYDLLPMIREALAIKRAQGDAGLKIVGSAWTAPPWMKDSGAWYVPASAENGWEGHGGSLKPECVPVWADYLARWLDAYADAGVPVWGLTPVNEPHGNGGHWECMSFTPESQNVFIRDHLGPRLREGGHGDVRVLIYDQNRDGLEAWTDVIYSDPVTAPYVHGAAVHWYASTVRVYEETFDRVHARFPDKAIIHTEGCIDALGGEAPGGIADPAGYQEEERWFGNDAWWWEPHATDWAYTATWAANADEHPMYTPVHRYARNIIVSLDHWVSGWIDWNIVLDRKGGPNHVGNFCGAPIMIDTATGEIHYTPVFHVLSQFSRTIRPGDRAVKTERALAAGLDDDALHACATVNADGLLSVQLLNTTAAPIACALQIGGRYAEVSVPANAVQTVRVAL